jgi:N-sulfoglucosamine sulfohydrolase
LGLTGLRVEAQQHVVFVTIDDLSRESLGLYGCTVPDITPNIDALGVAGLRFEHCHVAAANCTPSRNVMMSGMYPHNNKVLTVSNEGSGNIAPMTTIPHIFSAAGYHTGIMGKNSHMAPFHPYSGWDVEYDGYGSTRDPENVYSKLSTAFADAATAGKPLYFNLNLYDPHVGWYGFDHKTGDAVTENSNHPSRIYTKSEVPYPSWFPTLNQTEREVGYASGYDVMDEVTAYYNTVKRADDSIGRMMDAITDAGQLNNTIIILISDHGVELPGVKTMLYHHSSVSPLFVIWPGVTTAGTIDSTHVVNSVDFLPTFCELVGQPIPTGLDGRSFIPIVQGGNPSDWPEYVYKEHSVGHNTRAVQTTDLLYIFNPWSDGSRKPTSVTKSHACWTAIEAAGQSGSNPDAEAWYQMFEFRVVEELYDITVDPDCQNNLISNPAYATQLADLQAKMEAEMMASNDDDMLVVFQNRTNQAELDGYIAADDAMRADMKNDAQHNRDVFFDPLDDWVVIDHSIFEPSGEWGIWTPETTGIAINSTMGHKNYGDSCIEFSANTRLVTSSQLDFSGLSDLKLDAIITAAGVGGGCTLTFQYDAGAGWVDFGSITAAEMTGEQTVVMGSAPTGPATFGIKCAGISGGLIYFDGARFSGWENWTVANTVLSSVIQGTDTLELLPTTDATGLGVVRVDLKYKAAGISSSDRMVLEYFDGTQWEFLKAYAFDHADLAGYDYVDIADLHDEIYTFSSTLSLRLRAELSGGSITVESAEVSTRQNALGSGKLLTPPDPPVTLPELFRSDFESQNFTTEGWVVSPTGIAEFKTAAAYTGTYGVRLKKGVSITATIDATGHENIEVAYARRPFILIDPEDLTVEWRPNGSSWNTLEVVNAPDDQQPWTEKLFELPASADDQANLQLRFTVVSSLNVEKAYIDQVVVSGAPIGSGTNTPPVFSVDPIVKANGTEDVPYSDTIAGSATDADSDPLIYSSIAGPTWLTVAANGSLSGTPLTADVGLNSWTVQVDDGNGGTDNATLNITVDAAPVNQPPAFTVDPFSKANATENAAYSGSIAGDASDPESDPMTFSKVTGPAWLSVAANGSLSGTPGAGDVGLNVFTVQVSATGGSDTATLNITVDAAPVNQPPAFTVDPFSKANATENAAYSGSIAGDASDPESDPMTFSKVTGPAWLSIAADGTLSGIPGAGDVGLNVFTVQVDATGGSDTASLNITVDAAPPGGWTELTNDDFESGWGNWLDGGADALLTSVNAIGSQCLNLQDNSNSSESELASSLDLTGYTELKIEFSYVVKSFENAEDFWVRYSSNGGSSWTTIKAFVNDVDFIDDGTRYNPVLTIDSGSYTFSNNVKIMFECDASGNNDDVYIDNVVISAQ